MVQPERLPMTIRRMRIACWIPKATDTNSEHAIRIAFPLQQWLYERASMLRSTYTACLLIFVIYHVHITSAMPSSPVPINL